MVAAQAGAALPHRCRPGGRPCAGPSGGTCPSAPAPASAGSWSGAVVYALLLSVVEFGTAGPGMWFKAKFLNEAGSTSHLGRHHPDRLQPPQPPARLGPDPLQPDGPDHHPLVPHPLMNAIALALIGLWIVLQTTEGQLAQKLGFAG